MDEPIRVVDEPVPLLLATLAAVDVDEPVPLPDGPAGDVEPFPLDEPAVDVDEPVPLLDEPAAVPFLAIPVFLSAVVGALPPFACFWKPPSSFPLNLESPAFLLDPDLDLEPLLPLPLSLPLSSSPHRHLRWVPPDPPVGHAVGMAG